MSAGALAFAAILAYGPAALAQQAGVLGDDPLRGTDDLQDGDTLRGTAPGVEGDVAPIQPSDGAPQPDTDDGKRPGLRPTVRPDESSTAKARRGPPPLPQLEPYPVVDRKPRGAAVDTSVVTPAGPTVAALPVPLPARRPRPDPTPFAPTGIPLGSLRFTPFVEQSLGFGSNPDQVASGTKPSAFSRTEGGFGLLSDWSSNQLRADLHGAYDAFFSDPAANRPDAAGTVDYRYDASRELAFDTEGRFAVTTQRPGSPEVGVDLRDRPLISSFGGTLGGSDTLGRLTLALHGTFDRTSYDNGSLPDGTVVRLDDQNFNDYGLALRASYEVTPALQPFVELKADTRVHDQRVDISGFARDSDGLSGLVGTTFELTHLITGEASVGYGARSYQDPRLRDLEGPLVNASLAYAVTPLTTLTLAAATTFDETTVAGSPGVESRSVSLQVSHALLRNLTLTGLVGYLNSDYINSTIQENTVSATVKASYSLSRSIVLEASYNHATLKSTLPSSSFDQDVVQFGLRIQE